MALDVDKRKPLTEEHLAALAGLDRGVTFNTTHTVARELIALGLASSDWGRLAITEEGRRVIRRLPGRTYQIIDTHVADLSLEPAQDLADLDPMAAPHRAKLSEEAISVLKETLREAPPAPLPPPGDDIQRAMRAAGVASGVTGVWVEEKWVHAFIDAFTRDDSVE
jgi:hypothetical protein